MNFLTDRYRHLLPSVLLAGGFLLDVITFRTLRPDVTFLLLGAYAFAAAVGVVLGERGAGPLRKAVPLMVQFTFGALLSSAFLFYWFGGAVAASWPVMLVTVALMASNETFREAFLRPAVQFGVFTFVFFSYCTLLFPFLLQSVSAEVFLLGAAAATLGSSFVAEAIGWADKARRPLLPRLRLIASGMTVVFVASYFLNIIPPIPLSIREASVVYDVTVRDGQYLLTSEPESFLQGLWPGQTLHLSGDADGRLYVYTAIYAPTNLSTTIVHRWQRYDAATKRWADAGEASSYVTRGGRAEGYRGYSYRSVHEPGTWRVLVETERGQELGRLTFVAVE